MARSNNTGASEIGPQVPQVNRPLTDENHHAKSNQVFDGPDPDPEWFLLRLACRSVLAGSVAVTFRGGSARSRRPTPVVLELLVDRRRSPVRYEDVKTVNRRPAQPVPGRAGRDVVTLPCLARGRVVKEEILDGSRCLRRRPQALVTILMGQPLDRIFDPPEHAKSARVVTGGQADALVVHREVDPHLGIVNAARPRSIDGRESKG